MEITFLRGLRGVGGLLISTGLFSMGAAEQFPRISSSADCSLFNSSAMVISIGCFSKGDLMGWDFALAICSSQSSS